MDEVQDQPTASRRRWRILITLVSALALSPCGCCFASMGLLDNSPNALQPPRYPGSQQLARWSGGGSQVVWVKTTDRAPADVETVRAYLVAHDPTLTLEPNGSGYSGVFCDRRWVIRAATWIVMGDVSPPCRLVYLTPAPNDPSATEVGMEIAWPSQ